MTTLSRRHFFSRRVVAFHILIHQLDELGDDVVALESGNRRLDSNQIPAVVQAARRLRLEDWSKMRLWKSACGPSSLS
jgi:hypothetical protein